MLDEFPEIRRATPQLENLLRALLERIRTTSKLRILLCGSAVRTMQEIQKERSPLYGRFTLRLQVHRFEQWEAGLMLPDVPARDQAVIYGILGGIPRYLSWWDTTASLADNLRHLLTQPSAPLLTEGELVMASELESRDSPAAVLHAIAAGRTKYSEIHDRTQFNPTRTLDRLTSLDIIERLIPVTEREAHTRRRIYRISDNFLAFYLRIIALYRTEIERGLGESILPVLLDSLDDVMGDRWEDMVLRHTRRLANTGALGLDIVRIGPWWNRDSSNEIDIVELSGRSRTVSACGETKWRSEINDKRLLRALRTKAASLADDPSTLTYILAARDRVAIGEDVIAITADGVFSPTLT